MFPTQDISVQNKETLEDIQSKADEKKKCVWIFYNPDNMPSVYHIECIDYFIDSKPCKNFKFCPYCGKEIEMY